MVCGGANDKACVGLLTAGLKEAPHLTLKSTQGGPGDVRALICCDTFTNCASGDICVMIGVGHEQVVGFVCDAFGGSGPRDKA